MTTDRQIIQWIRQNGATTEVPQTLYWFAKVNESNVVQEIFVYDQLQKNNLENYPDRFPNLKLATEDTQIGDTLND
jgi:hypothetical protein|tara:strand:- start:223 stop:450 length:228 start_codon:yes stop_codon:yes gene_type:complete